MDSLDDIIAIVGLALVGVGLWQIYPPIAFVVIGAVLIIYALKASKDSNDS